jgi:hypothetical protein
MRSTSRMMSIGLVLVAVTALAVQADYLSNGDLKNGIVGWHGDGEAAFLNADGTEGAEGDAGVTPVIKLALSKGQPRAVYQEYETRDNPTTQHIRVDVFASNDFKRSTFASDYSTDINWKPGGVWYWSAGAIPKVDFWIRGSPGFIYKLANLKPGQWVTVDGRWDSPPPGEDRAVYFFVPAGEGTVYLKNAVATP